MTIMPLNTPLARIACKFRGFTNFVSKLDYSHFCSDVLYKMLSLMCKITVQ